MRVAVIGVTGLVGREMLTVMDELDFPVSQLLPAASNASRGKTVIYRGEEAGVLSVEKALEAKPDVALFSAGAEISKTWAPLFVEAGALVIDNSSAWRMDPQVPLVVPEVNLERVGQARLVANPNCSTIQLALVLASLEQAYGLQRVVITTLQSVTGSGKKAVNQLETERSGADFQSAESPYPHPIDLNCIPQCDSFQANQYTREEMKLVEESRKILALPELRVTATCVRVPVVGGHSESVNLELKQPASAEAVRALLASTPGVTVLDEPAGNRYPTPRQAQGRNDVLVGRIRQDESLANGLNLWIVADNLRKGAATNAVQIAKGLLQD